MNYDLRRQNLLKLLQCPALVVTEAKNRRYFSGFSGSAGWLLLTPERSVLLTDGRYWDQVAKQCEGVDLFKYLPKQHGDLAGALLDCLGDYKGSVHLDTHDIGLATFRSLSTKLAEAGLGLQEHKTEPFSLRACKDDEEIELLQKAAAIADEALGKALKGFAPGGSEADLKAELEYQILKSGGSSTSFATIVASGPNGSYPHAGASERKIQEGELITIDFGAVYQGYCSDMTRTIWYGELPKESEEILRHTRDAQKLAVDAVKPGLSYGALDAVARDHLAKHNLDQYFVHSLGHGVGLDIHEAPGLRSTSEGELTVGQVVTIEPGVYLPGKTGCRVEDTVVVTEGGCRILNSFPKQRLGSHGPPTD